MRSVQYMIAETIMRRRGRRLRQTIGGRVNDACSAFMTISPESKQVLH